MMLTVVAIAAGPQDPAQFSCSLVAILKCSAGGGGRSIKESGSGRPGPGYFISEELLCRPGNVAVVVIVVVGRSHPKQQPRQTQDELEQEQKEEQQE